MKFLALVLLLGFVGCSAMNVTPVTHSWWNWNLPRYAVMCSDGREQLIDSRVAASAYCGGIGVKMVVDTYQLLPIVQCPEGKHCI